MQVLFKKIFPVVFVFVLFVGVGEVSAANWRCKCNNNNYKTWWNTTKDICDAGCPAYCASKGTGIVPISGGCFEVTGSADDGSVGLDNPLPRSEAKEIVGLGIKAVMGVLGSLSLLMFFWGGFQWLIAAGSPEKIKKGQQTLVWAVVGLVVVFASYTLLNFVFNVF